MVKAASSASSAVLIASIVLIAAAALISAVTCCVVLLIRRRRRELNSDADEGIVINDSKGCSSSHSGSSSSSVIVLPPSTAAAVSKVAVQPSIDEMDFGHRPKKERVDCANEEDNKQLLANRRKTRPSLPDLLRQKFQKRRQSTAEIDAEDLKNFHVLPIESDDDCENIGEILLKVKFSLEHRQLHITAVRARNLQHCGIAELQPHCEILLLPGKAKPLRTQPCYGSDNHPIWRRQFVINGFQPRMLRWHFFRAQVWHGTRKGSAKLLGQTQVILAKMSEQQLEQGVAMWRKLRVLEDDDNLTHGTVKLRASFIKGTGCLDLTLIETRQLFLYERHSSSNQFAATVSLYSSGRKRAMSRSPIVSGSHLQVWDHSVTFPYLHGLNFNELSVKLNIKDVTDIERKRKVAVLELSASAEREDCRDFWKQLPLVGGRGLLAELKLSPPSDQANQ